MKPSDWSKSTYRVEFEDAPGVHRRICTWVTSDLVSNSKHDCEFHKNESTWCASNLLEEGVTIGLAAEDLEMLEEIAVEGRCLCPYLTFTLESRGG